MRWRGEGRGDPPVPTALSHCCGHVIPGGQRGETEHEVVLEDRLWIGYLLFTQKTAY